MLAVTLVWLIVPALLTLVWLRLLRALRLRPAFAPSLHFLTLFLAFWAARTIFIAANDFTVLSGYGVFRTSYEHVFGVTLIALLALVCYLGGVLAAHALRAPRSPGAALRWHVPASAPAQAFAVVAMLAILGVSLALFARFGGVANYILNWRITRFGEQARETSNLVFVMHGAVVFAWYLHYCLLAETRPSRAKRVCYWSLIAAAYLMFLALGERSPALLLAVAMLLTRAVRRRSSIARDPAIIALAMFVVAMIAYRNLRFVISQGYFDAVAGAPLLVYVLRQLTGDFLAVDVSYLLFDLVPARHEHRWSASIMELPASWIPRAWWPGKPNFVGPAVVLDALFPTWVLRESYLAPDILGDLYLNFALPGALAGMLLIGLLLGRADVVVVRQRPERALAVILLGVTFSFWALKSGLVGALSRPLLSYLPPLVALYLLARLRHQATRGGVR